MARQAVGLVAEAGEPGPAAGQAGGARVVGGRPLLGEDRRVLAADHRLPLGGGHRERAARVGVEPRRRRAARLEPERVLDVGRHAADRERLRPAGDPLELGGGQPEHLAELADRAARLEGREGGHERRVLAPVAVVHARDQHLADVAREVEVDVRQRGELLVEEAPEEELVGDRVDVREAGEVADDRGHRGAAAAARREQRAGGVRPADLDGDLARELEHVAVQEEEAGQAERVDHAQLLLEAWLRCLVVRAAGRVALLEALGADLGELARGRGVLRAGVAVAEVLGQVEGQAVGELAGFVERLRVVVGEARLHRLGRGEDMGEVASSLWLRGVERGVGAEGDEGVLERGAGARVGVDVAGGHARHAHPLPQLGEAFVPRSVVALERPLQLHAQVLRAEHILQPLEAGLVMHPLPGAAAQADQPAGVLLQRRPRERGAAARPCRGRARGRR